MSDKILEFSFDADFMRDIDEGEADGCKINVYNLCKTVNQLIQKCDCQDAEIKELKDRIEKLEDKK